MDPRKPRDPRDPRHNTNDNIYRPSGGQQQHNQRTPNKTGPNNEHQHQLLSSSSREGRGYAGHTPHNTNRGYSGTSSSSSYHRGSSFDDASPTNSRGVNNNNNSSASRWGSSSGGGRGRGIPGNTPYRPSNNNGPITSQSSLSKYTSGGASSTSNTPYITKNDSFESQQQQQGGGGGRKLFANPCRIPGHTDHDWKDCPNNKFRRQGNSSYRDLGINKQGSHSRDLGSSRGFGRGGGLSSSYSSMDRDGSRVGGGMSIDTDVSGHYGPASAVADNSTMPDSRGSHDSRGSFSERHNMESNRRSSLDRGGSTGSGLGLSGESGRGYSDMALNSSRSKSFQERDSGSNERGGGRYQPSPKPGGTVGGGDRRSSWSGQRGGVDRGDAMPGREGHHYQRSPSKGSQPQGTYASMQQSGSQPRAAPHQREPLPSPITSNSRGYSFTPQSQMKRSRSSGVDRSGPHHQGGTPGSAESGQIRDDPISRIPAPPFNNSKNPSPGQVRSPLFHRANSSPGEIRTGEKKHPAQHRSSFERHNRTAAAEEGEEGEEEGGEIIESLFESPSPRKPGLPINTSTANDYAAAARTKDGPSPSPRGTPRGYTKQTSTASLTASPRGYATFTSPAEARRPSLTTDMSPAVTKTKLPSTPHHSVSSAAEAAAKKAAAEQATPKLPPLTCTSLGDADKIAKAQDIVADMVELADFNSVTTDNGEMALPSKMQITQAMSIIENKIKLKGKEAMGCRKEVKALEVEEKLQAEKKVREQQERVLAVEHEFDMREKNRHEILSNKKDQLTEARQKQKSSLVEKREAEVSRMNGVCQSEIASQNEPINAQVTSLYTQMQASEQTIAEIDTAILQRELQESAAKYGTAIQPIIMAEDGTTDDGTGIPTMDMPGRMSALVGSILMQNQITAKKSHEEMLDCIPYFPDAEATTKEAVDAVKSERAEEDGEYQEPPKELISNEEWCNRARKVTGQHDALYTEPSEVPFYHENNAHFVEIAPQIKDCIRRKNKKLKNRWKSLADQYVVRQMVYNETSGLQGDVSERGGYHSVAGMIGRGGINNDGNSVDLSSGGTPSTPGGSELGVRGNNPYRRQRNRGINNGDVVRSDYELEQQIAEIAAKEAMEKRIKEGGCSLPRQRGWLENQLYATHSNGFFGREVDDELADDEERRHVNMWSDMEKCIFLDRFLHHPKDFRKIASFLKNKNTKDCIAFYYDSKKTVPYKHALKEFIQRKKRKGDVVSWDATIQSCLAMGAVIKAGTSPEQPLKFILPEHDFTYHTKNFHPMRLEVFENLEEVVSHAKQPDESKSAGGKKKRSNWFILDAHEKKYLKHDSSDDHHHRRKSEAMDTTSDDDAPMKVKRVKRSKEDDTEEEGGRKKQKTHKAQKWKAREKDMLYEALDNHGHDWAAISEIMGTRTPTQVKNYYYDNKKTITKTREKIAKIKAAADGRKKKKKRGLQGGIDTPKSLTPTTDGSVVDSRRTSLSSADAQQQQQAALQAHAHGRNDQDEQYRQQLQRMHQQDQLRQQILQQHLQQQQHQQRQEELYRHNQQMQQEEIYRQHLRQQEMLQMAQNAQHTFQQQQQNNAAQQQGNTVQQLQNLASLLQMRRSDTSPHPDNFQINQQLQQHLQDQQDSQNADLQRMFQAAANSGIPPHALEAALAASRGNMQPQQLQQQQGSSNNPLELLRRLAAAQQQQQQQQNQGGQGGYRNV